MSEPASTKFARRRRLLQSAALLALANFTSLARAAAEAPPGGGALASGRPSATAQGAAMLRAAHQVLDEPRIFADPLAVKVIGGQAMAALALDPQRYGRSRSLRAYVALRSRYAEDRLAEAVRRGVGQYVVLGAGLDTFAYRNPYPGLDVFEVDHPATQAWKRERLKEAGIAAPATLTFAPVDFEVQTLADGLRRAGLRAHEPVFFSLLGVAVYITRPALMGTLRFVASRPPGSEIVFSYSVPAEMLTDAQKQAREASAKRVAAIGEPWISYYDPEALAAEVKALGFGLVQDLNPAQANERYFQARADGLRVTGSARLMAARV